MKKITLLVSVCFLFGACSKTPTVSDYWKDEALRKQTLAWCAESPGERNNLPKCVNVTQAFHQYKMMTEFCEKNGVLDQQCANDSFKKWVNNTNG